MLQSKAKHLLLALCRLDLLRLLSRAIDQCAEGLAATLCAGTSSITQLSSAEYASHRIVDGPQSASLAHTETAKLSSQTASWGLRSRLAQKLGGTALGHGLPTSPGASQRKQNAALTRWNAAHPCSPVPSFKKLPATMKPLQCNRARANQRHAEGRGLASAGRPSRMPRRQQRRQQRPKTSPCKLPRQLKKCLLHQ